MSMYDYPIIKIAVLGEESVGKTCFVRQFVFRVYHEYYDMGIEDDYRKQFDVDDVTYRLDILDPVGDCSEYDLSKFDAFFILFSMYYPDSFHRIERYVNMIFESKKHLVVLNEQQSLRSTTNPNSTAVLRLEDIPIIIVGTGSDRQKTVPRMVTVADARRMARELNAKYMECSSRLPHTVDECFTELVRQLIAVRRQRTEKSTVASNNSNNRQHCLIS